MRKSRTLSLLLLLPAIATLSACRVQQDNPPRPLNARYHELPQGLVDRLLKDVPPEPPGANGLKCTSEVQGSKYVSYCVCYNAEACRQLAASDRCEAKIGEVRPGVGVCKWREMVTVVG